MPVFEYACKECEKTYDVFHKGKEVVEDVVCPACGSQAHRKLMSAPSVAVHHHASSGGGERCESYSAGGCCGGGACGIPG